MIAESPASIDLAAESHRDESTTRTSREMTLSRIVASLQVVLATRRAAHSEEHAYWYTIARGM
jgi:hypothetical protein